MTNEPEPTPPPAGWAPEWTAGRPRVVAIASTLWICLGVLLILGTIGYTSQQGAALGDDPAEPFALIFVIGIGVAFIVLATRMRRGRNGARIALAVLGSVLLLGIWTALLVIPALVLQFRRDSNAWFDAVKGRY